MAEEIERLVLKLEADTKGFEKTMAKAAKRFDRLATKIERRQRRLLRNAERLKKANG